MGKDCKPDASIEKYLDHPFSGYFYGFPTKLQENYERNKKDKTRTIPTSQTNSES